MKHRHHYRPPCRNFDCGLRGGERADVFNEGNKTKLAAHWLNEMFIQLLKQTEEYLHRR